MPPTSVAAFRGHPSIDQQQNPTLVEVGRGWEAFVCGARIYTKIRRCHMTVRRNSAVNDVGQFRTAISGKVFSRAFSDRHFTNVYFPWADMSVQVFSGCPLMSKICFDRVRNLHFIKDTTTLACGGCFPAWSRGAAHYALVIQIYCSLPYQGRH